MSFVIRSVDNVLTFTELWSLSLGVSFWILQGAYQFHWCVYQTGLIDKVPLIKIMFNFHILLVYLVKSLYIFL